MTPSTTGMDLRSALRRLTTPASETDAEAARLVGSTPDDEARRSLADVFADGDTSLPAALARALTGGTDVRTVKLLLPLLRNENPRVRNAARAVLEKIAVEAPAPVVDFSRDPDPRMRIFATSILGCMPAEVSAARLIDMLEDADPTVVDCAVAALGTLRAEAAVKRLADFLCRSRSWIRLSALDALMRIGTPPAVRAIVGSLASADEETASVLVSVLGRLEAEAAPELAAEIREALGKVKP